MLKTSEKIQIVSKEIEDIKKNQIEIVELKNTNNPNKMDGWQKRRGQRRESVNWNIEQQKLPNLEKERK